MKKSEVMKQQLEELKIEAQNLLNADKVAEAENKTLEVKILKAQIEIQEELDDVSNQLEAANNTLTVKDEEIANLTTQLETITNEKTEIMEKYNATTETVADLNAKVIVMQPIVDKFNEEEKTKKLNSTIENYKAKFEKVGGLELFESEEIKNLVANTISEDEVVVRNAKCALSDKLMEIIDKQESSSLSINLIQEPSKETKNLNQVEDEFEATYGFKK